MDVKSFVFIKATRIENMINVRQHFLFALSNTFYAFTFMDLFLRFYLFRFLKLTTLPATGDSLNSRNFSTILVLKGPVKKLRNSPRLKHPTH